MVHIQFNVFDKNWLTGPACYVKTIHVHYVCSQKPLQINTQLGRSESALFAKGSYAHSLSIAITCRAVCLEEYTRLVVIQ